ncbi:MAG TPA: hypothetical protein VJA21_00825 [Verrucomicrobiae bacterium]
MPNTRLFALALASMSVLSVPGSRAGTIQHDFSSDPALAGWQTFGDRNLFAWDATSQNLRVTWDSSRPNSYFYHPLGTILARDDDFSLAFDLRLDDIGVGIESNKVYAFELAIGLLNLREATRTNFLRGTGTDSPNLVELDYFRDAGFGATLWPQIVSSNSVFNYNGPGDYSLLELTTGDLFHVVMTYSASNSTLATTLTRNGAPFGPVNSVVLSTNFTDFRVDAFSISSYSDAGDDYDSVLAHGIVDNVAITTPAPPVANMTGGFTNGLWQVRFDSLNAWRYTLERTEDFGSWSTASPTLGGNGTLLSLEDSNPPHSRAFYRVRAERP